MCWGAVAVKADKNDCDRTRRSNREQLPKTTSLDSEHQTVTHDSNATVGFIALVPKPKVKAGGRSRPTFGLGPWDGARVGSHAVALSSAQATYILTRLMPRS